MSSSPSLLLSSLSLTLASTRKILFYFPPYFEKERDHHPCGASFDTLAWLLLWTLPFSMETVGKPTPITPCICDTAQKLWAAEQQAWESTLMGDDKDGLVTQDAKRLDQGNDMPFTGCSSKNCKARADWVPSPCPLRLVHLRNLGRWREQIDTRSSCFWVDNRILGGIRVAKEGWDANQYVRHHLSVCHLSWCVYNNLSPQAAKRCSLSLYWREALQDRNDENRLRTKEHSLKLRAARTPESCYTTVYFQAWHTYIIVHTLSCDGHRMCLKGTELQGAFPRLL